MPRLSVSSRSSRFSSTARSPCPVLACRSASSRSSSARSISPGVQLRACADPCPGLPLEVRLSDLAEDSADRTSARPRRRFRGTGAARPGRSAVRPHSRSGRPAVGAPDRAPSCSHDCRPCRTRPSDLHPGRSGPVAGPGPGPGFHVGRGRGQLGELGVQHAEFRPDRGHRGPPPHWRRAAHRSADPLAR